MIEVLRQIANANGLKSCELVSKGQKRKLYDLGFVFPAYGDRFHLTPAGKAYSESHGIEVAPFAWLDEESLRAKTQECIDSEWDRARIDEWLTKALCTEIDL